MKQPITRPPQRPAWDAIDRQAEREGEAIKRAKGYRAVRRWVTSTATGLLGVAFVVLKLCEVIDWSWWWVLSPFWLPVVVIFAIVLAVVMVASGVKRTGVKPRA
ncbi:MAG TPA: hypothetical protein VEI97_02580 [bacterium]|nr:hypothetical protein [bacterium]